MLLRTIRKYLGGFTANEVAQNATNLRKEYQMHPIIDYVTEGFNGDINQQQQIIKTYHDASRLLPGSMFAVKLSPFLTRDGFIHRKNIAVLVENLLDNDCKVLLDAEDVITHDRVKQYIDTIVRKYNIHDVKLYKTYQLYRRDALDALKTDIDTFPILGVKLVRGAYYKQDSRKHPGLLYRTQNETHAAYDAALTTLVNLLKQESQNKLDVIFATHNNKSLSILENDDSLDRRQIKVAQLLGMNDTASARLHDKGFSVYKYLPFGPMQEALPYLLRRLYENRSILKYLEVPKIDIWKTMKT